MNFDIRPFMTNSFISDLEWEMILTGTCLKLGKCYYAVYKNHLLTFIIRDNGNVELLNKKRKPSVNYVLPILTEGMSFQKRVAVYKEQRRLEKGQQLDSENFLKYVGS